MANSFFRKAGLCGLLAALAVTGATVSPGRAQDARPDQQHACARDVSRHCRKQMNDGDMVIFQCLQQNRDKLSPACRKVVEQH